jgi:hypothetical protein
LVGVHAVPGSSSPLRRSSITNLHH